MSYLDLTVCCDRQKVKVSHSLRAIGAVGVRIPMYLGHSPLRSLPYHCLIRNSIYCWVDKEFSSCHMAKPSLKLVLYSDFVHHK